jgi:hypothetical protein
VHGDSQKPPVVDLTRTSYAAIMNSIGVVRDLSRLGLDWTGQVGSGRRRCYWGPQSEIDKAQCGSIPPQGDFV